MQAKQRTIATILLITSLTFALAFLLPKPKNQAVMRDWFWFNKTFRQNDLELIVAGDSRVYRGVSISTINAQLDQPLSGGNLGYSSAGFSAEYFDFLENHFRENASQKVLILGITPFSFSNEAAKNEHMKSFSTKGQIEQWKALYVNPSLNLFEPRKVEDFFGVDSSAYAEIYHEDGWMESDETPGDSLKALRSYEHLFDKDRASEAQIQAFIQRIETLTKQGVIVLGFRPPTTPQMRALEDAKSGFKVNRFQKDFEQTGGFWLSFDDQKFATYDGSHLRPKAAMDLSEELGRFLQSKL